eukprot:m.131340 g.131340  ORF g.131340 m.131340 type:complete len:816 (-) comp14792_c0_seq10:220-2667(-)
MEILDLYDDVLMYIFKFLPFVEIVCSVSHVCRRFQVLSHELAQTELDFSSEDTDNIDDVFLSRLTSFKLNKLNLTNCNEITNVGLHALREHCPTLQTLVYRRAMLSRAVLVEMLEMTSLQELDITGSICTNQFVLHQPFALAKRLRRLACSAWPWTWSVFEELDTLTLTGASDVTIAELHTCPRLRHLKIVRSSVSYESLANLPRLHGLVLEGSHIYNRFRRLSLAHSSTALHACLRELVALDHLELHSVNGLVVDDLTLNALSQSCHLLRTLRISGHDELTDHALDAMATMPALTHLSVTNCRAFTDYGVALLLSRCTGLVELALPGCTGLTNETMHAIARTAPQLTSLDVSYCTAITSEGLYAVAVSLAQLRDIRLFGVHFALEAYCASLLRRNHVRVHYRRPLVAETMRPRPDLPPAPECACGLPRCICRVRCPCCAATAISLPLFVDHLEMCVRVARPCTLECGVAVAFADQARHLAVCTRNTLACKVCRKDVPKAQWQTHQDAHNTRRSVIAPPFCPVCLASVPSIAFRRHLLKCPEWILSCPACSEPLHRTALEAHLALCTGPRRHALPGLVAARPPPHPPPHADETHDGYAPPRPAAAAAAPVVGEGGVGGDWHRVVLAASGESVIDEQGFEGEAQGEGGSDDCSHCDESGATHEHSPSPQHASVEVRGDTLIPPAPPLPLPLLHHAVSRAEGATSEGPVHDETGGPYAWALDDPPSRTKLLRTLDTLAHHERMHQPPPAATQDSSHVSDSALDHVAAHGVESGAAASSHAAVSESSTVNAVLLLSEQVQDQREANGDTQDEEREEEL